VFLHSAAIFLQFPLQGSLSNAIRCSNSILTFWKGYMIGPLFLTSLLKHSSLLHLNSWLWPCNTHFFSISKHTYSTAEVQARTYSSSVQLPRHLDRPSSSCLWARPPSCLQVTDFTRPPNVVKDTVQICTVSNATFILVLYIYIYISVYIMSRPYMAIIRFISILSKLFH
jgi:hypothetical protein